MNHRERNENGISKANRRSEMKTRSAKRAVVALASVFLLFAPPGTLLFALIVGVGLLRRSQATIALLAVALVGAWFFWRRRSKKKTPPSRRSQAVAEDD